MNDKKEVGLNEVDTHASIAAWIVANDGCGSSNGVDCYGERGIFKGTACQFYRYTGCIAPGNVKIGKAKAWLEKYRQQKAEAAEAEEQKVEAAEKQEQEAKKTCGVCQHIYNANGYIEMGGSGTIICHKKSIRVPVEFSGCGDFEPMATRKVTLQSQHPAGERAWDAVAYAARISRLEKENARLMEEIEGYKKRTRRALEICGNVELSIDKAANEYEELRKHLNSAQEKISQLEKENAKLACTAHCNEKKMKWAVELCESGECDAKKDRADLTAKCERLMEQRNRLSNSLIEATRRAKEVERKNAELRSKHKHIWKGIGPMLLIKDGAVAGKIIFL